MEDIINSDPTLKFIINTEIDFNLLEHQVNIKCAAAKIALSKYLNKKY